MPAKKKMIPKRKTETITFSLSPLLREEALGRAVELDLSLSQYVRRLIRFEIDHPELNAARAKSETEVNI
jgi:hypothetical protein